MSPQLSNILDKSKFSKKSSVSRTGSQKDSPDEESDSSGDDHLVDPNKVDLSSDFFKNKNHEVKAQTPEFDCNVGCLTDSDDDDDDDDDNNDGENGKKIEANNISFDNLNKFTKNLEKAKESLKNYAYKSSKSTAKNTDVNALLAMGETVPSAEQPSTSSSQPRTNKSSKSSRRRHVEAADSDSDWEEVDGKKIKFK